MVIVKSTVYSEKKRKKERKKERKIQEKKKFVIELDAFHDIY